MTKTYCIFPLYGKKCSVLIPKCSKPQTKCTQKTRKSTQIIRKSNQFAISALFILDMDITHHNSTKFLFWWAYQPKFFMHNTRNTRGKQKAHIILSTWDSNVHACHNASIIATCVTLWYDMIWHDMTWYDMFSPSSVVSRHGVEKPVQFCFGTFSFGGERSKRPQRTIVQTYRNYETFEGPGWKIGWFRIALEHIRTLI